MAGIMPFGSKDRDKEGRLLLKVVASVLTELVASNEHEGYPSGGHINTPDNRGSARPLTKFHGLRPPAISIPDYLERISKFSGCSNECFVLSLIYIDRLITRKQVVLDARNVHRLIITSTMLAAKFFDDHYLDNAHYGAVGGVPPLEMNVLELEFLFLIEFNLHVTPSDYEMYRTALTNKAQTAASSSIPRFNDPAPAIDPPAVHHGMMTQAPMTQAQVYGAEHQYIAQGPNQVVPLQVHSTGMHMAATAGVDMNGNPQYAAYVPRPMPPAYAANEYAVAYGDGAPPPPMQYGVPPPGHLNPTANSYHPVPYQGAHPNDRRGVAKKVSSSSTTPLAWA